MFFFVVVVLVFAKNEHGIESEKAYSIRKNTKKHLAKKSIVGVSGTADAAVACNTRGPGFKSGHKSLLTVL